jgi:hypothetical protein
MQQRTNRQLYAYWDDVRKGRAAPRRFEIEPARIAALLPETFITECGEAGQYRFRLAGTRICEYYGRELRGLDLLDFWTGPDREAVETLLQRVFREAVVGQVLFQAYAETGQQACFELGLLPLVHSGESINRALGAICASELPFWLGTTPLVRQELVDVTLIWPDGPPSAFLAGNPQANDSKVVRFPRRPFRVHEGARKD